MSDPRPIRVYFGTSVFGGVFDDEFATASHAAFEQVRSGRFLLLLGATTAEELASAPDHVQTLLAELDPSHIEVCATTDEVRDLRVAYLAAAVLSQKWIDDATHVAAATVHGAQLLLSWNFKHTGPLAARTWLQRGESPGRLPADQHQITVGDRK